MNFEKNRIFISDLPETASKTEIEKVFSKYGQVKSVEIKERKELGTKNKSLFFSYINIEISDRDLQKCFKDFANTEWHGQYVELQLARESFLERLKRERKENQKAEILNGSPNLKCKTSDFAPLKIPLPKISFKSTTTAIKPILKKNYQNEAGNCNTLEEVNTVSNLELSNNFTEEVVNLIIKNNKNKSINKNGLHISSVGKEPIIKIDTSKKHPIKNESEANLKRLRSLTEMKKGYQAQKRAIKAALLSVDIQAKNKIVFDDSSGKPIKSKDKGSKNSKDLFEEEDNDDFVADFNVKEQFLGKKGKELMELQFKYRNDKRFKLDERFLGQDKEEETLDNEQEFEAEEKKQLEILEQVIGKKIVSKTTDRKEMQSKKKTMIRFDPAQPSHLNFEVKGIENKNSANKRKRKDSEKEEIHVTPKDNEESTVSKEVFYKVSDSLKDTFQEKQEFSLLSMFGNTNENKDESQPDSEISTATGKEALSFYSKNPFKYDSSDDEDEIPHQNEAVVGEISSKTTSNNVSKAKMVWSEPLFFRNDDYRLQEGFEFMERMQVNNKEFSKIRRDLKEIVKAKVRNNERKNKMFKRKLGGNGKNKRRKAIRIKNALKR